MQEYVLQRLAEDARMPTLQEVLDRAGGRAGGHVPLRAAVKSVRADRDGK